MFFWFDKLDDKSRSLFCIDSERLKLSRRARAGVTARLILVSKALVAMDKDCKGAILLEAEVSVSSMRSNLLSIFFRLCSIKAEALSRVLKSVQAS